jgi:hypothetical protein
MRKGFNVLFSDFLKSALPKEEMKVRMGMRIERQRG